MGRLRGEHRAANRVAERVIAARLAHRPTTEKLHEQMLAMQAVSREQHQRREAISEALAPLDERLRRLRLLSAIAPDRPSALTYTAIAHELDEDLNVMAEDLFDRRLTFDDLPTVMEAWISEGHSQLTCHDLHGAATQSFEPAGTAGVHDEVWSWMDRSGVDLGHAELMDRIQVRWDSAHDAGERDVSSQLGDVLEMLEDFQQQDELAAIQTAVTLPAEQRPAYLHKQETALRQRVQERIEHLVDDLDLTVPRLVLDAEKARQREDGAENAVRAAYDMSLWLATKGREPDNRWISLAYLRSELEEQADLRGEEPYLHSEIDAALLRLTRNEASKVQMMHGGNDLPLSHADHHAAIQVDGVAHHLVRIDYPADDQEVAASTLDHEIRTAQTPAVGAESRWQHRGQKSRSGPRTEVARSLATELDGAERDTGGPAL
ncbi:hypothetical protein [Kribbella ginsengisoli]|uniref:DUF222 domain-containing protein n=1 Tax=Kribbella ginsengisoli TaxID=363865 RepID=A0ABP6Z4K3_9ACTN